MRRFRTSGFTLVELLVVIVVIAILAIVTAAIYQNAQIQARDTQLADAADKVADAVQLFASKEGHFPAGGSGASTAPAAGMECANGADGWLASGLYTCTVEDSLVNLGYLPSGFSTGLPRNTQYAGGIPAKQGLMVYKYGTNKAMVFYSMEQPTASDTSQFNAELTQCGVNPAGAVAPRDTYGMRNGICLQY